VAFKVQLVVPKEPGMLLVKATVPVGEGKFTVLFTATMQLVELPTVRELGKHDTSVASGGGTMSVTLPELLVCATSPR
jgi:hypothetical protein